MSTTTLHPLAAAYLDRLREAGRRLPRGSLRELVGEVEAHLLEATDAGMSDAEVLTVLDRLGDPEEIVEAQAPSVPAEAHGAGAREWSAIVLLLFGGFIFGVGWLVGFVLLWSSRAWTTKDKLIGTLIVPGGLATSLAVNLIAAGSSVTAGPCSHGVGGAVGCGGSVSSGPSVLEIVIAVLFLLGPIGTAIYLAWRARRGAAYLPRV